MEKRTYYFLRLFLVTLISLLFIELTFKVIAFKNIFGLELVRIFIFSISASLIVAAITSFLNKKLSKILVSIFVFLVGFYALLQLTFNNLLGNFMSLNASSGGGLSRVVSQIPEFIKSIRFEYLIVFLPFIVLLVLFIKSKSLLVYERPTKLRVILIIIIIIASELLGKLSVNLSIFEDKNQIKSNKDLYRAPTLLSLSLKEFGALKFFERDIIYMINPDDGYSLEIDK